MRGRRRLPIVPVPGILGEVVRIGTSPFIQLARKSPLTQGVRKVRQGSRWRAELAVGACLLVTGVYLALRVWQGSIYIPLEIGYLFVSSILMYILADVLLAKLFIPVRYLEYSIPLIIVLLVSAAVANAMQQVAGNKAEVIVVGLTVAAVILHWNINKGIAHADFSRHETLYEYLHTVPKHSLIAAHPGWDDGMPAGIELSR